MATENLKLGPDTRLLIGKTAAATLEADFVPIENEQEMTATWSSDPQKTTNKRGTWTTPGNDSWEIKFTTAETLSDAARKHLRSAKNKPWPYKVSEGEDVWLEGKFLLSQAEIKAGSVGVREGSYTLQSSGPIVEHDLD